MRGYSLFLAAILMAGACGKPRAREDLLRDVVAAALVHPPCSQIIPSWSASLPVPTGNRGGKEFSIFFFAVPDREGDHWLGTPSGRAVIELDSSSARSCERGAGSRPSLNLRDRFSPRARSLGVEAMMGKEAELDGVLEKISRLYSDKRPLTSKDEILIKRFGDLFSLLAEPPFWPNYRDLNPGFWRWAVQNGATLPKQ